jgi:hypothetical protein
MPALNINLGKIFEEKITLTAEFNLIFQDNISKLTSSMNACIISSKIIFFSPILTLNCQLKKLKDLSKLLQVGQI